MYSVEVESMDKPFEISTISDRDIMSAIQENGWYIDKVEETSERCLEAVKKHYIYS